MSETAHTRARRRGTALLLGLLLIVVVSITGAAGPARAAATDSVRTVDCGSLPGSGSYSDPIRLGLVSGTLIARGCSPLTSGRPFNSRYFLFSIDHTARVPSTAGARFTLTTNAVSAVHPRLAAGAVTLLTSSAHGLWTGQSPNFTGRWLPLAPLPGGGGLPAGEYRLGFEKLDSPLRSLTTPPFDAVVAVN